MITPLLWRLFSARPLNNALFRRASSPRPTATWWLTLQTALVPFSPLIYLFLTMVVCSALTLPIFSIMLTLVILGVVVVNGTLSSMAWGLRIAGEIAAARESGTWELLCVQPAGVLGALWATATGALQRDHALHQRTQSEHTVLQGIGLLVLALTPCALLDPRASYTTAGALIYTAVFALLFGLYADYVQSSTLGMVVGVLMGTSARSRFDAQLWTLGMFLAAQVIVYALFLLVALVVLPLLVAPLATPAFDLALIVSRLAAFVGVREAAVWLAWRALARQLDVGRGDVRALIVR